MKKYSKKIICVLLVIGLLGTSLFILIRNIKYIDPIQLMLYKHDEQTPYSRFYDLNNGSKKLNLYKILNNEKFVFNQTYCIVEDKIYFSYTYAEEKKRHWCLCEVGVDGNEVKVIYDEVFAEYYRVNVSSPYADRHGYFYEDRIVLTDFEKVIEYDITTGVYKEFRYDDYTHPEFNVSWQIAEDDRSMKISKNDVDYYYDLETLAQQNSVIKDVVEKNNYSIWSDESALKDIFHSIQVVNNEMYLNVVVYDYSGSTYVMVFKLDVEKNLCSFVADDIIFGSLVETEFYIVPSMNQSGDGSMIDL